jgi:hypothetical protein
LLPPLSLSGLAAGCNVMSNVASVITTTTNTIVANAKAAVSFGRWSNLAIMAPFLSLLTLLARRIVALQSWREIGQMAQ